MNSYFFLDLEIPKQKFDWRGSSLESTSLCKFGFIDMLTRVHGFNVLDNNPWFTAQVGVQTKKKVSFKPTEIFGRDDVLPHCVNNHSHNVESGHLHAIHCKNYLQETPEILGQHVWMNRRFLIESRFGELKR